MKSLKLNEKIKVELWYSDTTAYGKKLYFLNIPFINGYINIKIYVMNVEIFGGHIVL
ncbi:MAG: hypothetical protein N2114_05970 [Candidatus Goldbacteria bacterium]|nr:hypothetical protein [Candidatus Goldiibacteriota bacterium]